LIVLFFFELELEVESAVVGIG